MLFLYTAPLPHVAPLSGSDTVRQLLAQIGDNLQISPLTVQKTKEGRPFLKDRDGIDISFAHSRSLAVCALLQKEHGHWRVGVDAEPYPTNAKRDITAFARRFFAPCEQQALFEAPDKELAFLTVFTKKEAYAKYCGKGLGQCTKTADTCSPAFLREAGVRFLTRRHEGHILTVCLSADCHPTVIEQHESPCQ